MKAIDKFWNKFLIENNLPSDLKYTDVFYFDITEKSANKLLRLVRKGKKKATTSLYIEKEYNTKIGDYNIVTTFKGYPSAIIQIKDILIKPFKNMSFDLVKLEGEDRTFESWQKKHIEFLSIDAKNYNIEFNMDTLVVFEIFNAVYINK